MTRPPYVTTGIFITGFDAKNNPNPDDKNAGMKQIADPINLCIRSWDTGTMNPGGITNDLIPVGFVDPPTGLRTAVPSLKGRARTRTANPGQIQASRQPATRFRSRPSASSTTPSP